MITTLLDSITYCYVLLPCLPCYSSYHLSLHMRSFSHPGVARLRPSISTYRTSSTVHPGVSRVLPIIPATRYTSLPSPGSYCMAIIYRRLQLLASRKISSRVAKVVYLPPLAPPRLSPATAPLIACLTCAHFKYRFANLPTGPRLPVILDTSSQKQKQIYLNIAVVILLRTTSPPDQYY